MVIGVPVAYGFLDCVQVSDLLTSVGVNSDE
jgi:hypothetical protein